MNQVLDESELLLPKPQRIARGSEWVELPRALHVVLLARPQELRFAALCLQRALGEAGIDAQLVAAMSRSSTRWAIRLGLQADGSQGPQSYRLEITTGGATVLGGAEAGLFYGVSTLLQLIRLHRGQPGQPLQLPALHIEDWPDLPVRGAMLDVSRDRVPTMATLLDLVDLLASCKINQLQLYVEHTFAYESHERVWREASPLTGEEILALDHACRERHIELVPNQNSFGHLHRWLVHEPYRQLAECPEGIEHPFSEEREPYSLCPLDPRSLELLADLYDQLLPHFTSRRFNVGLDETLDLGRGRSAERCAAEGTGRVYLAFLHQVHRLVSERGHSMQLWDDIILRYPELIGELPRDVTALEWGYEADHPFAEHLQLLGASGLSFYVCPGTSSWNSIAGRSSNALANIARAAQQGHAAGARGLLVTDWGDHGHLQPLPVSYLGLLAAAGCSWNVAAADELDARRVPRLLDFHAFRDRAGVMGQVAHALGDVHLCTGARSRNGTFLFKLLITPAGFAPARVPQGLSEQGLRQALARIEEVMAPLGRQSMERTDAQLVVEELAWAADMLRLACRLGLARCQLGLEWPLAEVAASERHELAAELETLLERHRSLWLRRSRPGGLGDSLRRLERTLEALR